jgi:hypothetical protein
MPMLDHHDRPALGQPGSWTVRRRFMFAVSAFCMCVISWVLWRDMTSSVAEAAVVSSFFVLATIVGSYVFGAAWQDNTAMRVVSGGSSAPMPTPLPRRHRRDDFEEPSP